MVKTADRTSAELGDIVTYTYEITNTGEVDLTNLTLSDDKIPGIVTYDPAQTLAVDETITETAEYTITQAEVDKGSVTNTATATGVGAGATVTGEDTLKIPVGDLIVEDPAFLTVTKDVVGDHEGAGLRIQRRLRLRIGR